MNLLWRFNKNFYGKSDFYSSELAGNMLDMYSCETGCVYKCDLDRNKFICKL